MQDTMRRVFSGVVVILLLSLIFSLFLMVFHVRASDVEQVRQLMAEQAKLDAQPDTTQQGPTVSRWNFSFYLPVAGSVDEYHWKIKGGFSRSIDMDRDRITRFDGDFRQGEEPIRLQSPVIIFDKKKRRLTSDTDVQIDLSWCQHQGTGFYFDMDKRICKTDDNSHTVVEQNRDDAADTAPDPAKPAAEVFQIKSKKFYYYMEEDRLIYQGEVFGWDQNGVIAADKMEVFNYTAEEKSKNPELSGVKRIICTGNVKIDQGVKWAIGDKAVFDKAQDVVVLSGTDKKRAVYWALSEDGTSVRKVAAQKITDYREKNRFIEADGGALRVITEQITDPDSIDKAAILGFDSTKLELIKKPDTQHSSE